MSDESDQQDELESIGWDAIDAALAAIYGKQEPKHFAPVLPAMLGGDDPLQGISVYKVTSPMPHFHFVTYGFSELYEKESDDAEFSGYGFELTFRLNRNADDDEPPAWPISFLQNIAKHVFSTGNAFDERHHMTLNGPIALAEQTDITAIVLVRDPQLGELDTRNGHVKFLQVVGLCDDEYALLKEGYFDPIVDRVSALSPMAIMDISRPSILSDKALLDAIVAEPPKTSQSELFGTIVEWREEAGQLHIRIGATLVGDVCNLLSHRTSSGEPFAIYGKSGGIVFEAGSENGWKIDESLLVVALTKATAADLAQSLKPIRGNFDSKEFPALRIEVAPVEIKGSDGDLVKTIG